MRLPTIYNVIKSSTTDDYVYLNLQKTTDKLDVFSVKIKKIDVGRRVESTFDVRLPKFYYKYTAHIINEKGYNAGMFELSPMNDEQKIDWNNFPNAGIDKLQYIYEFCEI